MVYFYDVGPGPQNQSTERTICCGNGLVIPGPDRTMSPQPSRTTHWEDIGVKSIDRRLKVGLVVSHPSGYFSFELPWQAFLDQYGEPLTIDDVFDFKPGELRVRLNVDFINQRPDLQQLLRTLRINPCSREIRLRVSHANIDEAIRGRPEDAVRFTTLRATACELAEPH